MTGAALKAIPDLPVTEELIRSDATLEPEPLTLFLVGRTLEGTVFHLRS